MTKQTTVRLTEQDLLDQLPALSGFAVEPKQDVPA